MKIGLYSFWRIVPNHLILLHAEFSSLWIMVRQKEILSQLIWSITRGMCRERQQQNQNTLRRMELCSFRHDTIQFIAHVRLCC